MDEGFPLAFIPLRHQLYGVVGQIAWSPCGRRFVYLKSNRFHRIFITNIPLHLLFDPPDLLIFLLHLVHSVLVLALEHADHLLVILFLFFRLLFDSLQFGAQLLKAVLHLPDFLVLLIIAQFGLLKQTLVFLLLELGFGQRIF